MGLEPPGSRRWSVSVPHRALVDAIRREMGEYLSYYAELAYALKREEPDHPVLDARRTVLIILLASYIEAVINLYLSFAFGPEEFKRIDEFSIFKKWTSVPARRIPSYRFDRESEVFKAFESLVECRNSIAHMRPEFMVDGKIIHGGNGQPLIDVSHKSIMRWIRLPLELVDMVSAQDKSDAGQALRSVSDAWDVSQGWDERLSFYAKQYAEGQGERRFSSWPLI